MQNRPGALTKCYPTSHMLVLKVCLWYYAIQYNTMHSKSYSATVQNWPGVLSVNCQWSCASLKSLVLSVCFKTVSLFQRICDGRLFQDFGPEAMLCRSSPYEISLLCAFDLAALCWSWCDWQTSGESASDMFYCLSAAVGQPCEHVFICQKQDGKAYSLCGKAGLAS